VSAPAAAAGVAGGAPGAREEEYFTPLPWLPNLRVPVTRPSPAFSAGAPAAAGGSAASPVALSNGCLSPGMNSRSSSSGGTAVGPSQANLPWLLAGLNLGGSSPATNQQQVTPSMPPLPWLAPPAQVDGSQQAAGMASASSSMPGGAAVWQQQGSGAGRHSSYSNCTSSANGGGATQDVQDAWASPLLAPGVTSGAATRPSTRTANGQPSVAPGAAKRKKQQMGEKECVVSSSSGVCVANHIMCCMPMGNSQCCDLAGWHQLSDMGMWLATRSQCTEQTLLDK
jgi:hypothetical protein